MTEHLSTAEAQPENGLGFSAGPQEADLIQVIDLEVANERFIHLIRNAVDHGVEMPADRQQAGKDPRGTIRLSATHEANHIVLRI